MASAPTARGATPAAALARVLAAALAVVALALGAGAARAHEFTLEAVMNAFFTVERGEAHLVIRAPLYLFKSARFPVRGAEVDVDGSAAAMQRALAGLQNGVTVFEDGRALKASSATGRLTLPSDRSFDRFDRAAAHVAAPVAPDTRIVVDQGYVDAHLVYPVTTPSAVFALRTTVAPELGDYLKLALRVVGADGTERALVIRGGSGVVDLNPSALGAAADFVGLGVVHILTGADHLLFLLCLVIPLRGARQLLTIVTSFTLAHSITLIGASFGLAPRAPWFAPLVEMVIALSIVYTALENIVGVTLPRRVLVSMLFGLAHGFAFSYGLAEQLQFAGTHLRVSLFAFNVGVEVGQILALAAMLPALALVTGHVLTGRVGAIILSALVAHVGWHWAVDRWDALGRVRWPSPDGADLVLLVAAAGAVGLAAVGVRAWAARLRLGTATPPRPRERAG